MKKYWCSTIEKSMFFSFKKEEYFLYLNFNQFYKKKSLIKMHYMKFWNSLFYIWFINIICSNKPWTWIKISFYTNLVKELLTFVNYGRRRIKQKWMIWKSWTKHQNFTFKPRRRILNQSNTMGWPSHGVWQQNSQICHYVSITIIFITHIYNWFSFECVFQIVRRQHYTTTV